MTRQCCKCRRFARGTEWILHLEHQADNVTHTYCPKCLTEERAAIREYAKARAREARLAFGT